MTDSPSTPEELKNELDIVFRAVWTQELIDNMPDYQGRTDLIGSPIFYDSAGNLDVEMVSAKMGVAPDVIRVSHESWVGAGNKPPIRRVASAASAASTIAAPGGVSFEPTPIEPQGGSSTIRDATTHYQEVAALNHARNQYEASQGHTGPSNFGGGSDQLLATLMTELIRGNSAKKSDSDSLVMLKLLESQERNSERSRQDQAMMMNAMNQNQTQMMGIVIDSMRNGGGKSSTDEALISMALDGLRSGGGTEESVLDSLVRSGQLADITGSIATGLKSVLSARSPPVGAPPSYATPQYAPPPMEPTGFGMNPPAPEPMDRGCAKLDRAGCLGWRFGQGALRARAALRAQGVGRPRPQPHHGPDLDRCRGPG